MIQPICLCGEPLQSGANYCTLCGREVRQICPVCFEERRLLHRPGGSPSSWCLARGELLNACVRCGRWLQTGISSCPDPNCGGVVEPVWPASVGKSPNGAGRTNGWQWPSVWDRHNPAHKAPVIGGWQSSSTVYAAFLAHGRLYAWTGDALLSPDPPGASTQDSRDAWRCWLGFGSDPEPAFAASSLAALLGGAAILAARNDFVVAGLYTGKAIEAVRMNTGTPIAHTASALYWAGWAEGAEGAALWYAPVSPVWRNTAAKRATQSTTEMAPRRGSKMLIDGDTAYWVSEGGVLCALNCTTGEAAVLTAALAGQHVGWCDARGVRTVTAGADGIRVALDPVVQDGLLREAAGGDGPLRDLFMADGLTAVVGDTVVTLDSHTGYVQGGGRFNGQWIAGAIAPAESEAPDQEPRLLMLTRDGEDGSLVALRPSSGGEEFVWRARGIRPIGLLTAGSMLSVVHDRGTVTIGT